MAKLVKGTWIMVDSGYICTEFECIPALNDEIDLSTISCEDCPYSVKASDLDTFRPVVTSGGE